MDQVVFPSKYSKYRSLEPKYRDKDQLSQSSQLMTLLTIIIIIVMEWT
jgi:hypothetical protein